MNTNLLLCLLLLSSCGGGSKETHRTPAPSPTPPPQPCMVLSSGLTCISVDPPSGGRDGASCSVSDDGLVTCGDSSYQIPPGDKGDTGDNGERGTTGSQGIQGIAGEQGDRGDKGDTAEIPDFSIVEIIDPCGAAAGYNEVLLRLKNGTLLAHYASGNNQFLVVVPPGSYRTTDGSGCRFSVDQNYNVTW